MVEFVAFAIVGLILLVVILAAVGGALIALAGIIGLAFPIVVLVYKGLPDKNV